MNSVNYIKDYAHSIFVETIFNPMRYTGFILLSCSFIIGCGNITSFYIMRGIQAVEVVAGWACFHSGDKILKFPWEYSNSLSCIGVVRNVCLLSKPTFRMDCL